MNIANMIPRRRSVRAYRAERIVRKASDTAAVARHVIETLRECGENGDIDAAMEALTKERAFDALTQDADIAEVAALVRLVNENKRISLSSRRLDVYERRSNLGVAEDAKKQKKLLKQQEKILQKILKNLHLTKF